VRRNLEFQLDLMDATNVVVTTNVELRRNGRPYANQGSSDTGLAVYFTRKGCEQAIAAKMGLDSRQPPCGRQDHRGAPRRREMGYWRK
jgi:hypothetical protein